MFSYVKNLGTNALKSVAEYVSEGVEKLAAKKYKDQRTLCVENLQQAFKKKWTTALSLTRKKRGIRLKPSPDGVYKYRVINKEDDNTASK